jgi:hypothetical protein
LAQAEQEAQLLGVQQEEGRLVLIQYSHPSLQLVEVVVEMFALVVVL